MEQSENEAEKHAPDQIIKAAQSLALPLDKGNKNSAAHSLQQTFSL